MRFTKKETNYSLTSATPMLVVHTGFYAIVHIFKLFLFVECGTRNINWVLRRRQDACFYLRARNQHRAVDI